MHGAAREIEVKEVPARAGGQEDGTGDVRPEELDPVWIGAAGLAAHLPGGLASLTARPVIGIPLDGGALGGADALYSVVQMPPGVPVASVAIGSAGAKNAGHLAARILALADPAVAARVAAFRDEQAGRAELRIDPRA